MGKRGRRRSLRLSSKTLVEYIPMFAGHFMFRKQNHEGALEARHLTFALLEDGRVVWAEQQFGKLRVKRDFNSDNQYLKRVKRKSPGEQELLERELFKRLVQGFAKYLKNNV